MSFADFGARLGALLFSPTDKGTLAGFYCIYILLYVLIHVTWDIRTPRTPPFHVGRLRDKTDILHSSVTLTSSWLLILTIWQPAVEKLANDVMVPIILAGFSGILYGIGKLCPYEDDI